MKAIRILLILGIGVIIAVLGTGIVGAQSTDKPTPVPKGKAVVGENRAGFDAGGANVWTYEGSAGEVLTLMVEARKPANKADQATRDKDRLLDTEVFVYDPKGGLLASNDDIVDAVLTNSFLRYVELKATGTYTIEVTNWYRSPGDETEGHYTLIIYSQKSKRADTPPKAKVVGGLETASQVMEQIETMIEDADTHTVMIVNPTYCTITGASFGDLQFDLKPYSGIIIEVPKGWYSLRGQGDLCDINNDEINVPKAAVIMATRITTIGDRPADVEFPSDPDALANA